jgi:hypothetical protein
MPSKKRSAAAKKAPTTEKASKVPPIPLALPQLIIDFTRDLTTTFPEYADEWKKWTTMEGLGVVKGGDGAAAGDEIQRGENEITYLFDYFSKVYPERFFDILYQNEDIFSVAADSKSFFLPGVDFRKLYHGENVGKTTKDAIWKYLQLILFSLTSSLQKLNFGQETGSLFDGIDEGELQNKIQETVSGITDFFSQFAEAERGVQGQESTDETEEKEHDSNNGSMKIEQDQEKKADNPPMEQESNDDSKSSGGGPSFVPNAGKIFEKLKTLFDGKIGTLAKKLMEEMSDELKEFMEEMGIQGDGTGPSKTPFDFKQFMKNPQKMMNLIKKMTDKLKDKFKTGEVDQADIMKEAGDFMKQFKEMGGAEGDQFKEMFKNMTQQMGLGKNVKIDKNALARMESRMKMGERMRANVEKKKQAQVAAQAAQALIQKTQDGSAVFSVPGGEKQEKSSKEEIERIMKDLKLDEVVAATTDTQSQNKKKNKKKNK